MNKNTVCIWKVNDKSYNLGCNNMVFPANSKDIKYRFCPMCGKKIIFMKNEINIEWSFENVVRK